MGDVPPTNSTEALEAIARIIDPLVFELSDALNAAEGEPEDLRAEATAMRDKRLQTAFAKAKAIHEALASTYREENERLREGLESIESEILAVLGGSLKGRTHDVWQRAENSGMHNALGIVRKHRQALTTPRTETRGPMCVNHPDRPVRTNLDGDDLCQECADAWVRGEGAHAAWLEAEEAAHARTETDQ